MVSLLRSQRAVRAGGYGSIAAAAIIAILPPPVVVVVVLRRLGTTTLRRYRHATYSIIITAPRIEIALFGRMMMAISIIRMIAVVGGHVVSVELISFSGGEAFYSVVLFVVGRCGGAVVVGMVQIVVIVIVAAILGQHYFLVQYETVITGGTVIIVIIPIHPGLLLLLLSLRIVLILQNLVRNALK